MNQLVENTNYLSRHFRIALEEKKKKSMTKSRSKNEKQNSTSSPISSWTCPVPLDAPICLWVPLHSIKEPLFLWVVSSLNLSPWPHCILHPQSSWIHNLSLFLTSPLGNHAWHHIWLGFGLGLAWVLPLAPQHSFPPAFGHHDLAFALLPGTHE